MDDFIWGFVVLSIVVGLPWLILHYVTRWKTAATLTGSDEKMLEEMHDLSRRLDDRLCSIERIMTAENPNWRQQCTPDPAQLTHRDVDLDAELARLNERSRIREVR